MTTVTVSRVVAMNEPSTLASEPSQMVRERRKKASCARIKRIPARK